MRESEGFMSVKFDKIKIGQMLQAGSGTYKSVGRKENISKTSDPLIKAYTIKGKGKK